MSGSKGLGGLRLAFTFEAHVTEFTHVDGERVDKEGFSADSSGDVQLVGANLSDLTEGAMETLDSLFEVVRGGLGDFVMNARPPSEFIHVLDTPVDVLNTPDPVVDPWSDEVREEVLVHMTGERRRARFISWFQAQGNYAPEDLSAEDYAYVVADYHTLIASALAREG